MNFAAMPKIPRWSREVIVTEKIDGTNASVLILPKAAEQPDPQFIIDTIDDAFIYAGSRTRFVVPGKQDNYGWAGWVQKNVEELFKLGFGHHFGEWWGAGIQRRYGLTGEDNRFSLFDTRWAGREEKPACVSIVPVLYTGPIEGPTGGMGDAVANAMWMLRTGGSVAAPGFMNPEGVIVWHSASRQRYKKTFEKDQQGKGE